MLKDTECGVRIVVSTCFIVFFIYVIIDSSWENASSKTTYNVGTSVTSVSLMFYDDIPTMWCPKNGILLVYKPCIEMAGVLIDGP